MTSTQEPGSALVAALSTLFADGIVVRAGDPEKIGLLEALFPEELAAVANAVPKRQREYAAARVLARGAFSALGVAPAPLLNHDDRSPRWPRGLTGSLTHTDGLCAVAVAPSGRCLGVGIDAERTGRVERHLFEQVLTPRERRFVDTLPTAKQGHAATLIFSAKESLYKFQFPLTKKFVGFQEAEIDLDFSEARFQARFLVALGTALPGPLTGRWVELDRHVVTAVSWGASS